MSTSFEKKPGTSVKGDVRNLCASQGFHQIEQFVYFFIWLSESLTFHIIFQDVFGAVDVRCKAATWVPINLGHLVNGIIFRNN